MVNIALESLRSIADTMGAAAEKTGDGTAALHGTVALGFCALLMFLRNTREELLLRVEERMDTEAIAKAARDGENTVDFDAIAKGVLGVEDKP
jgi:hypothetical protein